MNNNKPKFANQTFEEKRFKEHCNDYIFKPILKTTKTSKNIHSQKSNQ